MKNKLMMTVAVAALVSFSASVQANPVPITQGLNNFANNSTLSVYSTVTGAVGNWTYSYTVSWVGGPNTGINGFTVDIDDTALFGINSLTQPGTFTGAVQANEVSWTASPDVDNALPLTFTFNSPDLWTLGNSGALDSGGYTPFKGSGNVYIPTLPDGGTTVGLLGLALGVCGLFARKFKLAA